MRAIKFSRNSVLLSDKSRSLQYSLGFGVQGLSFARMEKARSVLPRGRRGGRWPCCQHPGLPGDTTVVTCHRSRECHPAEAAGCGHLCRLPGHPALRCLQHRWLGRHAGHRVRHCHGHRGAVTSARARFDGSQLAQSGTTLSLSLPVLVGLLVGLGASTTVLTCGARRVPPCPPALPLRHPGEQELCCGCKWGFASRVPAAAPVAPRRHSAAVSVPFA